MRVTLNGITRQAKVGSNGSVFLMNGTEVEGVVLASGRVLWVEDLDYEEDKVQHLSIQKRVMRALERHALHAMLGLLMVSTIGCGDMNPAQPTEVVKHIKYHACADPGHPGQTVWTNVWPCSAYTPTYADPGPVSPNE